MKPARPRGPHPVRFSLREVPAVPLVTGFPAAESLQLLPFSCESVFRIVFGLDSSHTRLKVPEMTSASFLLSRGYFSLTHKLKWKIQDSLLWEPCLCVPGVLCALGSQKAVSVDSAIRVARAVVSGSLWNLCGGGPWVGLTFRRQCYWRPTRAHSADGPASSGLEGVFSVCLAPMRSRRFGAGPRARFCRRQVLEGDAPSLHWDSGPGSARRVCPLLLGLRPVVPKELLRLKHV